MSVKECIKSLQSLPEDVKVICQNEDGNKIGDLYQIAIIFDEARLIIKNKQGA